MPVSDAGGITFEESWSLSFKIGEKMPSDIEKAINAIVAQRLRQRRKEVGLTQLSVAAQLGVSFQQLQKYEHGANRITAARLYQLAEILDTSITYFFDGANPCEPLQSEESASIVTIPNSVRLARQFDAISSAKIRHSILSMVRSLQPG